MSAQLAQSLRELRKWLNEEPNRPIDRVALARVLFSHEASPQTGQKSVASDLRDALAGCLSLLQCHEHPLRRGAMMPEPQCMLDARAALAAFEAAPQQAQAPIDPDGEQSRAGFRAFDEAQMAQWATPWQVWREAVKWAAQQAQAPGWQPIETAPKDGRTVQLGYFNSHGKWRSLRGQWMSADYIAEYWEDPDEGEPGWYETSVEKDDTPNCWRTGPTHWMPLPAAPQQGSKS